MATSANPAMQKYSARTQVIAHVSLKMAQTVAMIVPPVYVVATLARRRPFTIRGLMNTSTAWTTGGALAGVGIGYARLMNEPQAKIDDRAVRLRYNVGQVRADDYSVIGAAVGAILSPAIFLRRASIPLLVLGGASMGLGAGVWTDIIQSLTNKESVVPEQMAHELPGADKKV